MRGKAKQRVSLILVVTMVLGTALTGNTVFATGESSDGQDRIKINISKDSEQTVEQNVTQTIHVTAQGQCSQSVCLNVYLKNEDGSAATDIDAVNLLTSDQLTDKNTQKTIDETLKDSVTLNNGTKASPTAEWKNDKDDNGTVTSKYLQITMPADAIAINFDMQLQYRTDEASYTKKVLVEAKAFEEEQDITEAAKRADESKENEATVVWEGQAVSQSESEAADENADGENALNAVAEENQYTVYFQQSKISDSNWDNATQIYIYAFDNNNNNFGNISPMAKEGESNSQNVWKYTFNKAWTNVIFLTQSNWPGDKSCQTVDLQIDWGLNQPCFQLTSDYEKNTRKKKANQIAYQGTTQPADGITVYYDATLSKLSYAKTENVKGTGDGIPHSEKGSIYIYATKDTGTTSYTGKMEIAPKENYKDVYKVTLPKGYTKIRFAADPVNDTNVAANGDATDLVDIPEKMTKPCYYGDSSDDIIYQGTKGNRGGYWGEAYTVRDAERGKKNATVVDVPNATEKRDADNLYVNTTIYDYYSDYELNGKNRDNYPKQGDVTNNRIYQPFRQFNMALSDYYQKNQAKSPLYWGNFQNYSDSHFNDIAETMGLFGYNINSSNEKFFYENNSMWGRKNSDTPLSNGNNATQGLVANQLNNNSLQLETESNGTVLAPFFDKDFLNGNNSKNTVLGKVYENVTFPFVKKGMYWTFDSADDEADNKNLQLKYDDTDKYFLQSNTNPVKGRTTTAETSDGNYFPLNSSDQSGDASRDQSGDASRLNYGFGQKFDLKFRLTSNGQVVNPDNNEKENIKFNFSGDDDVWVFIDGQLVLDIGGDHGVVTGNIDFAKKKATVSSVKNASSYGVTPNVEKSFPTELNTNDYFTKEHTLTMFYMERGLWESNMKITFNFPQENTLTVEKEVDTTGANDIFKKALADVGTFDFEIKNLATSGDPKDVSEPSSPEVKEEFNDYSNLKTISGTEAYNSKVEVKEDPTNSGKGNIITSYYPGKKNATDPQSTTDLRLVKIQAKDGNGNTFDASDSNRYKYLQFDVYNTDENTSGTDPFVALVDDDGTRIGAWASFLTYNGRNNNIDKQTWKTIRIDLEKLKERILDAGEKSGFNFSKVKEIQFAYWNDVTVYLDKFAFVKPASVEKTGFTTEQKDIPDYGSINSKKLEPVNGAYYQNTKGDTIIYSDGLLGIGNKESAVFSDQFRRGSYLSIAEKNVSPDVFTTTWSLYENGAIVNPSDLTPTESSTVTGSGQGSVENQSGYEVKDGRAEKEVSVGKPTESTIVFRSYANPDSENAAIDLKAKYVNKLRTGSISLKKSLSEGETESQLGRKYQFIIEYRNIAGMKLEANIGTDVITQTIELEAGKATTIQGIPAGTDYTIYEVIPDSADYSLEKVNVTKAGNDKNVKVENNVVTGIVVADDGENSTSTSTEVTFVNTVTPLISISGTKTWEGGETADTPGNIVVQIQRLNPNNVYEQAKDKSGNVIPNQVVNIDTDWRYTFTGLLKYVDYQASPQQEYKYRVVELGTLKSLNELKGTTPDPQNPDHIKQIAGYYPEYTTATDGSYNITNRKTGTLKIIKKTGNNEFLEGAEFTLYTDSKTTNVAKDYLENDLTGTTGKNGELVFDNIITGTEETPITYYLKEVKTKAGYVLLKEPIKITLPYKYNEGDIVNGNKVTESGVTWNLTYTIINDKAFNLPASGNKGIFKFIVIGITAVLVGGYLLTARKKSRKKRVSRRG